MEIAGKVALVTGASSGIGRATAVALGRAGAAVMVADVDEVEGAETVREVDKVGGRASFVLADVAFPHGVREMFKAVEHVFGGVDIVHNNAGLVAGHPGWPDMDLERIKVMCDVNLAGVAMGTRAALDHLRARGGGAIVNTASLAALEPYAADPVYGATKAAVVSLTKACIALADEGIRVNAVLPGVVRTPLLAKTGDGGPAPWVVPIMTSPHVLEPEEVAEQVLDLIRTDAVGEAREVRKS